MKRIFTLLMALVLTVGAMAQVKSIELNKKSLPTKEQMMANHHALSQTKAMNVAISVDSIGATDVKVTSRLMMMLLDTITWL